MKNGHFKLKSGDPHVSKSKAVWLNEMLLLWDSEQGTSAFPDVCKLDGGGGKGGKKNPRGLK